MREIVINIDVYKVSNLSSVRCSFGVSQTRPSPAPSPRDNGIQLVASAALHPAAVAPSQESRLEVLARDRPHRVAGNDHDLGRRLGRGSPRRRLAEVWARARRREGDLTLLFVARLPALRRFLVRGALPRNGGATPEHGLLVEAERSLPRRLRRSRLGPLKVSLVERGRASTWMLPRRWRAEIFLDREARPGTGSAAPAALPAPVTEAAPVRLLLMLMLLDRVLRRGSRCAHRASRAGDTLQAPRQLEHLCAESVKGEHGRGRRLAFRKPEFVSVQCRQLGVCRCAGSVLRCTAASGRAFAQQKSLPRAFPVQPSRRWALRATQPSGGPTSSSSYILLLFRQQSHCQRVRKQHHAQRYVKADYAADQLVQGIRYLTGTVHQHRVVLLEHGIMHLA